MSFKKKITLFIIFLSVYTLPTSQAYKKKQNQYKGMTVSQVMASLEDKHYYEEICEEHGNTTQCMRKTPYKRSTVWPWFSKEKKEKIKAQNLIARNNWIKKSKLFSADPRPDGAASKLLATVREEAGKGQALAEESRKELATMTDQEIEAQKDSLKKKQTGLTQRIQKLGQEINNLRSKNPFLKRKKSLFEFFGFNKKKGEMRATYKDKLKEVANLKKLSGNFTRAIETVKDKVLDRKQKLEKRKEGIKKGITDINSIQAETAKTVIGNPPEGYLEQSTKLDKIEEELGSLNEFFKDGIINTKLLLADTREMELLNKINDEKLDHLKATVQEQIENSFLGEYIAKKHEETLARAGEKVCDEVQRCSSLTEILDMSRSPKPAADGNSGSTAGGGGGSQGKSR